jgi:hypothetical protein
VLWRAGAAINAYALTNDDPVVDRLTAAIARYVSAHPNASDTAEGVGRWWVPEEAAHASAAQLEDSLERLVAQQVVMQRALPDGRLVYTARIVPIPGGAPLED